MLSQLTSKLRWIILDHRTEYYYIQVTAAAETLDIHSVNSPKVFWNGLSPVVVSSGRVSSRYDGRSRRQTTDDNISTTFRPTTDTHRLKTETPLEVTRADL